jgi:hypothetical protein
MSLATLEITPASSIPNPSVGKISFFIDTDGLFKGKRNNGTVFVVGSGLPPAALLVKNASNTINEPTTLSLTFPDNVLIDNGSGNLEIDLTAYLSTYTNATPMPVAVLNYPAGQTFLNEPLKNILDTFLYPPQYPAFTFFGIQSQATTLEVGDTVITGAPTGRNFVWGTSNSTNVVTSSLMIQDITGSVTLASGLNNDGSELIILPSPIQKLINDSHIWNISGNNIYSGSFNLNYQIDWLYMAFWGTFTATTLTSADFNSLGSSQLLASIFGAFNFVANLGKYKYYVIEDTLPPPTTFKDQSTLLTVAMADNTDGYTNLTNGNYYQIVSYTNTFGVTRNYKVYRSKNILNGAITILVA